MGASLHIPKAVHLWQGAAPSGTYVTREPTPSRAKKKTNLKYVEAADRWFKSLQQKCDGLATINSFHMIRFPAATHCLPKTTRPVAPTTEQTEPGTWRSPSGSGPEDILHTAQATWQKWRQKSLRKNVSPTCSQYPRIKGVVGSSRIYRSDGAQLKEKSSLNAVKGDVSR